MLKVSTNQTTTSMWLYQKRYCHHYRYPNKAPLRLEILNVSFYDCQFFILYFSIFKLIPIKKGKNSEEKLFPVYCVQVVICSKLSNRIIFPRQRTINTENTLDKYWGEDIFYDKNSYPLRQFLPDFGSKNAYYFPILCDVYCTTCYYVSVVY